MPKKTKSPAPRRKKPDSKAAEALVASQAESLVVGTVEPRSHRQLAQAIFSQCNPVQIGCELLQSSSEKGASVRARVFETLANWQFGKTDGYSAGQSGVRVIWDIPRPPRESEEPQ